MVWDIAQGMAIIQPSPEDSFSEAREILQGLERQPTYRAGMPLIVDLRAWGRNVLADVVARRVAVLMKFIACEAHLKVAVLTPDPAAVSAEVEGLHRIGITATCFSAPDAARCWLCREGC